MDPFAPNSSIPVIADLNHSGLVDRVVMILNQSDRGPMTLFGGGGALSNFDSGRYTAVIPDLESGEYSLQLVAYGANNQVLATSALIRFKVKEFGGSLPPTVNMEAPEGFTAITHSSIIPLSANGIDPDGAIEWVQFYIDGIEFPLQDDGQPKRQDRVDGISESTQSYSTLLDINKTLQIIHEHKGLNGDHNITSGVVSMFVIGKDNRDNFVASDIYNLSFTTGVDPPNVAINRGLTSTELYRGADFNITTDSSGKITHIEINDFLLPETIYSARIDIEHKKEDGNGGTGAIVKPTYSVESSASGHRTSITGLQIESGGQGYDDNLSIRIVPQIRAINEGIPAEAGISYLYEFNDTIGTNVFKSTDITLRQNVDGSLRVGSGYVVAPRLITPPFSRLIVDGKDWERVPLDDSKITGSGTTSIAPFALDELPFFLEDAYLLGGFAQSPIIIEVNATQSSVGEKIESVSLVIDGKTTEDLTKSEPPFSFSWVPDEPKDYSIAAVVKDVAGNVRSTEESTFSVVNYEGSGIGISFTGESNLSVESNGFLQLTAEATSVYGIAEVEFFIDDKKVSHIVGDGTLTSFQSIINMMDWNFSQGEHQVSVLAKDFKGNIAGTFSKRLTNIDARKNKTLIVQPPLKLKSF